MATYTIPHDDANHPATLMARGLGWFSIALGAAELLAPGSVRRSAAVPVSDAIVQTYGAREIATGVALLAAEKPVRLVWGRVAGDLLDIATLLPGLNRNNPDRSATVAAMGFVLAATATDLAVAMQGDRP